VVKGRFKSSVGVETVDGETHIRDGRTCSVVKDGDEMTVDGEGVSLRFPYPSNDDESTVGDGSVYSSMVDQHIPCEVNATRRDVGDGLVTIEVHVYVEDPPRFEDMNKDIEAQLGWFWCEIHSTK